MMDDRPNRCLTVGALANFSYSITTNRNWVIDWVKARQ